MTHSKGRRSAEPPSESPNTPNVFLSTELAGRRQIQFARVIVLGSAVFFLAALPFAKLRLAQVPAFTPMYSSALVICDLITAVFLFGQVSFLRSRALLVLACGYLFTASITFAYTLVFPGLFSPPGLLGAGPQTTSALYMFWHGGFPLVIMTYALLKNTGRDPIGTSGQADGPIHATILSGVATVLTIVCGITLAVTAGNAYLPVFLQDNRTTDLGRSILAFDWTLSLLALVILWRRRPHTVIDLWLMVVMCAWFFDMGLAAIFNTGRYDFGWYAGRIYGLLAASFVLIVLLFENVTHYARLAQLSTELGAANLALELLARQDGLTDLANRRFFDSYLADQIAIARRHKRPLALVLCDIDSFKAYNDHYGHQAGDACLKQVATVLRSCCRRPADMAARYGGEEFALILPDTDLPGAIHVAEAARDAIARLCIQHAHSSAADYVSISGGIAILNCESDTTAQHLLTVADQGLYEAKYLGRNRIITMHAEPGSAGGPHIRTTVGGRQI